MKWIRFCSALVAMTVLSATADAGILDLFNGGGHGKSCGCAPTSQPACCKPTITRPCDSKVHTYQRKVSDKKPPCCDTSCAPKKCCAPTSKRCAPARRTKCAAPAAKCCAPAPKAKCAAPKAKCCAPAPKAKCAAPKAKCCAPAPKAKCAAPKAKCAAPAAKCCAPARKNGCAPATKSCCAPKKSWWKKLCSRKDRCATKDRCAKKDSCASKGGCGDQRCCDADPCEIAKLIYDSQTACYAKDRRNAIHKLGDSYDCVCNPEIMAAMIYALNDADERVRAKAADEIGDQLRRNPCCCSKEVTAALTNALADCDRGVRREAEQALHACGYDLVDGNCGDSSCDGCDRCGGSYDGVAPAPAPAPKGGDAAPAPAPPVDPKAYFPSRLRLKHTKVRHNRLSDLFGLLD